MRRFVVLLAAAVAAASLVAAAPAVRHPQLVLVKRTPLEVRGTGFRSHETVRVSFHALNVRVRSSSLGRFLATFTGVDRCSGGRVVALGAPRERAVLQIPPAMCPPA